MKTCSKCGVSKEETEFHLQRSDCKECRRAENRAYCSKNRDKIRARKKAYHIENRGEILAKAKVYRAENQEGIKAHQKTYQAKNHKKLADYQREHRYGITPEEFEGMLTKGGGICAICGGLGGKQGFCIDHDHITKEVRGLICRACNSALGYLKDSSKIARAAMKYLENYGK